MKPELSRAGGQAKGGVEGFEHDEAWEGGGELLKPSASHSTSGPAKKADGLYWNTTVNASENLWEQTWEQGTDGAQDKVRTRVTHTPEVSSLTGDRAACFSLSLQ